MKTRFIAGAVCPSCQMLDRLVIEEVTAELQRRCVNCNYSDRMTQTTVGGVPRGKPEKKRTPETVVEQIKVFDPAFDLTRPEN